MNTKSSRRLGVWSRRLRVAWLAGAGLLPAGPLRAMEPNDCTYTASYNSVMRCYDQYGSYSEWIWADGSYALWGDGHHRPVEDRIGSATPRQEEYRGPGLSRALGDLSQGPWVDGVPAPSGPRDRQRPALVLASLAATRLPGPSSVRMQQKSTHAQNDAGHIVRGQGEDKLFTPGSSVALSDEHVKPHTVGACNEVTRRGSVLYCHGRTLGEVVEVAGAPFALVYRSDRDMANVRSRDITLPIKPPNAPPDLQGVTATVVVEGKPLLDHFFAAPNLPAETSVRWDGTDGRWDAWRARVTNGARAAVALAYHFPTVVEPATAAERQRLDNRAAQSLSTLASEVKTTVVLPWFGQLGSWDPRLHKLGGWTLSVRHHLNVKTWTLRYGDGRGDAAARAVCEGAAAVGETCAGEWVVEGEGERYYFDAGGNHLRTRSVATGGLVWQFDYEQTPQGRKRLRAVSSPELAPGQVTTLRYNQAGQVELFEAPEGQATTLAYNTHGYLEHVTAPDKSRTSFAYRGAGGLLTKRIDPADQGTGYFKGHAYSCQGALEKDIDQDGVAQTLGGTRTRLTHTFASVQGAAGPTLEDTLVTGPFSGTQSERRVNGTLLAQQQSSADGRSMTLTEPRTGVAVRRAMRHDGGKDGALLSTTTLPNGRALTTQVAALTTQGDPNRPWLTTAATLTETTTDGAQQRVSTSGFGPVANGSGSEYWSESPAGRRSKVIYDALGRPLRAELPGQAPIVYAYDAASGRLRTVTQGQRVQRFDHSAGVDTVTLTDTAGAAQAAATVRYDSLERTTSMQADGQATYDVTYDLGGQVKTFAGHTYEYSPAGRLREDKWPAFRRLNDPKDDVKLFFSDKLERSPADGTLRVFESPEARQELVLDKLLRLESLKTAKLAAGRIAGFDPSWVYNLDGTLHSVITPAGPSVVFAYDNALPTSMRWVGAVQGTVGVKHGVFLRPEELLVNNVSLGKQTYDADGLLTGVGALAIGRARATGAVETVTLGTTQTRWTFDPTYGYVSDLDHQIGGASAFKLHQDQNTLGQVDAQTVVEGGVTTTLAYEYDAAGRLAKVTEARGGQSTVRGYTYDRYGNRTQITLNGAVVLDAAKGEIRHNERHQLVQYGDLSLIYSDDGYLVERKDTKKNETTRYAYASTGDVAKVVLPTGTTVEYVLDGAGRRVGKKVGGALERGWLYHDGLKPVAEVGPDGQTVTSRFVYGTLYQLPEAMERGGVSYRFFYDALGSLRRVVNAASGEVVQSTDYDEWGNITRETVKQGFDPAPFGYAGGLYDRATGLTQFGARSYDPRIGRWTSEDPAGFEGGMNLYEYVLGNPISFIDIDGNGPWIAIGSYATELVRDNGASGSARIGNGAALMRHSGLSEWNAAGTGRTIVSVHGASNAIAKPRLVRQIAELIARYADRGDDIVLQMCYGAENGTLEAVFQQLEANHPGHISSIKGNTGKLFIAAIGAKLRVWGFEGRWTALSSSRIGNVISAAAARGSRTLGTRGTGGMVRAFRVAGFVGVGILKFIGHIPLFDQLSNPSTIDDLCNQDRSGRINTPQRLVLSRGLPAGNLRHRCGLSLRTSWR